MSQCRSRVRIFRSSADVAVGSCKALLFSIKSVFLDRIFAASHLELRAYMT
jgi:hypothetical protein